MSFTPLSNSVGSALSGILIQPTKLIDVGRLEVKSDDDVDQVRLHGAVEKHSHAEKDRTLKYSIIVVIISAIIFVTIISIYDVLRAFLTNYYAEGALTDPNSSNEEKDIKRTLIANRAQLWSNLTFSAICIGVAVVVITILIYVFHLV